MDSLLFFFNDTATTEIYTLSLHDALPIYRLIVAEGAVAVNLAEVRKDRFDEVHGIRALRVPRDRKSTRLNSSHLVISYAVFCLKKKIALHVRLAGVILRALTDSPSLTSVR